MSVFFGIGGDVKIGLREKFCYAIGDPACNVVFCSNNNIEGMIYSAASVGSKLGAGLTSALLGVILDNAGYDGLAITQSATAMSAISNIFIWDRSLSGRLQHFSCISGSWTSSILLL